MTTTVRKQKSGDQLTVGDWLAPLELTEGAAEVLFTYAYPASADRSRDNDGKHIQLVVREQGKTEPWTDIVGGNTLFDLASDEDLAAYRKAATRAERVASIRALAGWLERHPEAPLSFRVLADEHLNSDADGTELERVALVRKLADAFGVKVDESNADHTLFDVDFGSHVTYQLVAWHKDGRPAEPAPEPDVGRR